MRSAIVSPDQAKERLFDHWARVYDTQENPLLALEERVAASMLPRIADAHVLDVGCGTGRWLTHLEALLPASLCGVDRSDAMLQHAATKVQSTTKLVLADCAAFPREDASCTFVMASFVLSYLDNLRKFANECARVLRTGGQVLISDMHPTTAAERQWKRGFHIAGEKKEIEVHPHSLSEIVEEFEHTGFEVAALIEQPFEQADREAFERAGKLAEFEQMAGVPAIYILSLRKRAAISYASAQSFMLINCPWGCSEDTWRYGSLLIENGHIKSAQNDARARVQSIDLTGYLLLPGLINAHDHLEFGLFPRLGRATDDIPFWNATEWASEIHQTHAEAINRYRSIPRETRLRWAGMRNLLCGVTTVCHHNPMYDELVETDFPVRVLSEYRWAHSLAFDEDVAAKHRTKTIDLPFLLHAAEGIDELSRNEIHLLDRMGVLDEGTVLIHGLACDAAEIELMNQRGASLVVCPTSNHFLFGRTHSPELLASVERLALGSDSSITAKGDLLDEVKYLRTEMKLDSRLIYRMVTTNAAAILYLKDGQGQIAESGIADLIAVRGSSGTPADILANLSAKDVELVLLSGRVQLASPELYERLPDDLRDGLEFIEFRGQSRWIRSASSVAETSNRDLVREGVRYAGTL